MEVTIEEAFLILFSFVLAASVAAAFYHFSGSPLDMRIISKPPYVIVDDGRYTLFTTIHFMCSGRPLTVEWLRVVVRFPDGSVEAFKVSNGGQVYDKAHGVTVSASLSPQRLCTSGRPETDASLYVYVSAASAAARATVDGIEVVGVSIGGVTPGGEEWCSTVGFPSTARVG